MKKIFPLRFTLTLAAILTGCAIEPVHFDGKSATYSHSTFDFEAVMLQAKDMCKSVRNKGIKHESTACTPGGRCVSTFICLEP